MKNVGEKDCAAQRDPRPTTPGFYSELERDATYAVPLWSFSRASRHHDCRYHRPTGFGRPFSDASFQLQLKGAARVAQTGTARRMGRQPRHSPPQARETKYHEARACPRGPVLLGTMVAKKGRCP